MRPFGDFRTKVRKLFTPSPPQLVQPALLLPDIPRKMHWYRASPEFYRNAFNMVGPKLQYTRRLYWHKMVSYSLRCRPILTCRPWCPPVWRWRRCETWVYLVMFCWYCSMTLWRSKPTSHAPATERPRRSLRSNHHRRRKVACNTTATSQIPHLTNKVATFTVNIGGGDGTLWVRKSYTLSKKTVNQLHHTPQ